MNTPGLEMVTLTVLPGGTGTYTISGPCTFDIGGGMDQPVTYVSSDITNGAGTGSLIKTGSGILCLEGGNTYSGGTTLIDGALGIGADSVVAGGVITSGALGTSTLTVASGSLQAVGGNYTLANNIVNNTGLVVNGSWNLTLTGVISGDGSLSEYIC